MSPSNPVILTLNAGSSSIRFSVYRLGAMLERQLYGKLERIGLANPRLSFAIADGEQRQQPCDAATDYLSAVATLLSFLDQQGIFTTISALGHRIVHGMHHATPEVVTPVLVADLRRIASMDPEHLPSEIALIDALSLRLPALPQVVCFDTAFHQHMPRVATVMAIPRRFDAKGVRRYGFHGLSYTYLMEELTRAAGDPAAKGRIIIAHLGNGASMAAIKGGQSIDTSMGFTPASGMVMGTRSGDIDPGLVAYLERTERITSDQFDAMMNHQSGLLGISETSSDMADLLAAETTDLRASEAVALFCYQAKKQVGAYAAALGGLDTLIFAGGIGEHAPAVRARICEDLGFLGIALDVTANAENAGVISTDKSQVAVRVMRTDEELMIARSVCRTLGYTSRTGEIQP